MNKSKRFFSLNLLGVLTLGSTGMLGACVSYPKIRGAVLPHETVLALGDSITYGTGASRKESYPKVLSKLTGWDIVNGGVPGNYSLQALQRLPKLLQTHQPQLVITSIGVNDFANSIFNETTYNNIKKINVLVQKTGAQHVIIAHPDLRWPQLAYAPHIADHPLYKRLAAEIGVLLVENILPPILADRHLLADKIHPNAQGYQLFAKELAIALQQAGVLNSIQWYNLEQDSINKR